MEKKVWVLDETGNVAVDETDGVIQTLTGVPAIRQNILLQILMLRGQGYLGVLWRGPVGVRWRKLNDFEPIPAIFDKMHDEMVALLIASECAHVPGVRYVTNAFSNLRTEEMRANREVDISVETLVGTDEFPQPIRTRIRQALPGI